MAFTYTIVKADALSVNDQVRAAVMQDGHCYVFPVPTTGGATFPTTVRSITNLAAGTPGAGGTDGQYVVQLNNASAFALPVDFTINDNNDFIVKATGTA
jgi:hypothetical protein